MLVQELTVKNNFPSFSNGIQLILKFKSRGSKWQPSTLWDVRRVWFEGVGGGWLSKSLMAKRRHCSNYADITLPPVNDG